MRQHRVALSGSNFPGNLRPEIGHDAFYVLHQEKLSKCFAVVYAWNNPHLAFGTRCLVDTYAVLALGCAYQPPRGLLG